MSLVKQGVNDVSNLKDILLTYNKITEECFKRCSSNFNNKELTDLEKSCVDGCCYKHINGNQRMMSSFMEIQSAKQKKMMEDMEKQQEDALKEQQAVNNVPGVEQLSDAANPNDTILTQASTDSSNANDSTS